MKIYAGTRWTPLSNRATLRPMQIGDVVADRFVIERPIGSGGMGAVFLAADRTNGGSVAIKVLALVTDAALERFRREADVLAQLSHPGIVRYVAHGETATREPFLAMGSAAHSTHIAQHARGGRQPQITLASTSGRSVMMPSTPRSRSARIGAASSMVQACTWTPRACAARTKRWSMTRRGPARTGTCSAS